ncbi:hypothetical protein BT96DRAFT_922841 [Gymnopus androsaceus JB14]|uniref:Uncharacterized protein n=1 Tax=Gymnopus androsaceus JB14 TaxID=1447944 RepID=A0A6A4HC87_9AGAR|nr:hypothetical protein BT96DRAFT_922841 [Gymnopus androsaceus JB14]
MSTYFPAQCQKAVPNSVVPLRRWIIRAPHESNSRKCELWIDYKCMRRGQKKCMRRK